MSVKGVIVDFDILKIKGEMLKTPKSESTKTRERFIDKKRRRSTRTIDQMLAQQQKHEASVREALARPKTPTPEVTVEQLKADVMPPQEFVAPPIIKKN